MAIFSITDSNLRRQDMEGSVSGTFNIGAGPGPQTNQELFYQGVQAWARRPNSANNNRGFLVSITSTDMTVAGDEVILFKGEIANYGQASTVADGGGLRFHIGSATGNHYSYMIADEGTQGDNGEFQYPAIGGWLIIPIDPNIVAWRDFLTGSAPTLTAITQAGISGAVTSLTVTENIGLDAIDIGPGLFGVGGDSTDPDGIWNDFVIDDEDTATAGRFGHVTTRSGVLYVFGIIAIGQNSSATSTLTVFDDSNQAIVFPGGLVDDGWNRVLVDTATAATSINFRSTIFKGTGRSDLTHFFSSAGDVDGTNNEIDIVGHGFITGDLVLYSDEGGTAVTGLTDATDYFVRRVTADAISLFAVGSTVGRQNAFTNTSQIGLTAAGTGENHKLTRKPQTLPDLTQTGTNGTASFDATSCSFDGFREITLTTRGTLTSCGILNTGGITLGGGTLDQCTLQDSILEEGEALVTDTTLDNITDNTFISEGRGHAVEITATGTFTYNNAHTGYGPDRAEFDTTSGVNGGTEVITTNAAHGFVDGDHVYYNDEGGAVSVGLTDGAKYYVNNITATTLSLHLSKTDAETDTARVDLTASGAETHSIYSGTAALFNSSGGAVTVNVTTGDSPSVRNSPGSTTSVVASVTIEINGVTEGAQCYMEADGITGPLSAGTEILNLAANSSGVAASTFGGTTPQGAIIKARSSGTVGGVVSDEDGVAVIDQTEAARDRQTTDDIFMMPGASTADILYIGAIDKFERINFDIETIGVGAYTLTWEYSQGGDTWAALTVVDTSDDFKNPGCSKITFTAPGDWATDTVTSDTGGVGPFFFIRARGDGGGQSTAPLGNTISVAEGNTVKYLPFESTGTIVASTGLIVTAVWIPDVIAS